MAGYVLATRKAVSSLAVLANHAIWLCVGSLFLGSTGRYQRESDFHPAAFHFNGFANGI